MDKNNQVATLLFHLGQTSAEVATVLKTKGIKGVRNATRFLNPVVRYMQVELPGARDLDVMTGHSLRISLLTCHKEEVALPQPVREFVDAFNRGEYPHLELTDRWPA